MNVEKMLIYSILQNIDIPPKSPFGKGGLGRRNSQRNLTIPAPRCKKGADGARAVAQQIVLPLQVNLQSYYLMCVSCGVMKVEKMLIYSILQNIDIPPKSPFGKGGLGRRNSQRNLTIPAPRCKKGADGARAVAQQKNREVR